MLNSTHTLVSPTPTTLERYLLEFELSMSVSFVSEYSRKAGNHVVIMIGFTEFRTNIRTKRKKKNYISTNTYMIIMQ